MSLPAGSEQSAGTGRYAPSPSGRLHVGNLRTAMLAWLIARSSGRSFLLRFEDLDPDRTAHGTAAQQVEDLAAIGLDWDGEPVFQSDRSRLYESAVERLDAAGLVYPCWCTRAELAAAAPHDPSRPYTGTCRELSEDERAAKEAKSGRPGALRARLGDRTIEWNDLILGPSSGIASDPVLRRFDGVHSYNLAVVVDDADQGVDQVVRGDDLADSVPVQAALCDLLGLPRPEWGHVPLVVESDGRRLAKRDGSTTLAGWPADGGQPLARLGASLGLCGPDEGGITAAVLLARFDIHAVPRERWLFTA